MQKKFITSLNVGVIAIAVIYVLGFVWQYSYLASITDHIGWIKVVTVDYLYLGVMALVFTTDECFFATAYIFIASYYSGVLSFLVKGCWRQLSLRKRVWIKFKFSNYLSNDKVEVWIVFLRFFVYVAVVTGVFGLLLLVSDRARDSLASRLASGPTDTLCERGGDCYKGKILYTSDKQIYFYTYEGGADYRNGQLLVIAINNASINLSWHPTAKARVDRVVNSNELN